MFKFFSDAKQELEHVVWPTSTETRKYMTYTVGVIVSMALILAVLGYVLRWGLTIIRDQFPHQAITSSISGEENVKQRDLDDIQRTLSGRINKPKVTPPKRDITWTEIISATPVIPIVPVGQ